MKLFAVLVLFTIATSFAEEDTSHSIVAQIIQAETGALRVEVYPNDADVYLNGKLVGRGSTLIQNLPLGQYEVYAIHQGKSSSENVYIIKNSVRNVSLSLGRKTFINVTSAFSQIWVKGIRAFGPSLQLELENGKNFYGICYHWDIFNDLYSYESSKERGFALGGAAFSWYHSIYSIPKMLNTKLGFVSGFWYFDGDYGREQSNPYDYYDYEYNYFNAYLFGGPSADFSIGYENIFLNINYSFLIGSHVGHALSIGVRAKL